MSFQSSKATLVFVHPLDELAAREARDRGHLARQRAMPRGTFLIVKKKREKEKGSKKKRGRVSFHKSDFRKTPDPFSFLSSSGPDPRV